MFRNLSIRDSLKNLAAFAVNALLLSAAVYFAAAPIAAAGQAANSSSGSPGSTQNDQQVPEAGGPQGDIGPMAVPKKKPAQEAPPPERAPQVKNPEGLENYSIRVDVPIVNLNVQVLSKDGMFIPGLKKENFRVFEDGVQQNVLNEQRTDAPITAVMVVEFAATNYSFMYDALNAAYSFTSTLKPDDWIAVESYDLNPQLLVDFTHDKRAVVGALNQLRIPGFRETNLFDTLYDVVDRLETLDGHKYVILISSGIDTFSKISLDKTMKKLQGSRDITIFAISTGQFMRLMTEPYTGPMRELTYAQADNQLTTFAKLTGGHAYFPRFPAEMPGVFQDVSAQIRNQYTISYKPTNSKQDGSFRKIKVDLINDKGEALQIEDQHHKPVKYSVLARDGYRAKQEVE